MSMRRRVRSRLSGLISRYVALKRALGRRASSIDYILGRLERFLAAQQADDLTRDTFAAWGRSMQQLHPRTQRARLRTVYHFCLFRHREEPRCFVPDPTQFPRAPARALPHIFSEEEIHRVLIAAESLQEHPGSPLHRQVARLAIVILYTTGLRRGEVARLALADYDATDRVLRIRQTKFYKSRLVPLSTDTAGEIDRYLALRRARGALGDPEAPLLAHCHGGKFRPYTGQGLGHLLRKVIRAAGIKTARGRPPRVHDLRFTFAGQALLRWYRAGIDVQARLPALSAYLGHASIVSTQYYLTFCGETATAASERFHAQCASWLPQRRGLGGVQ